MMYICSHLRARVGIRTVRGAVPCPFVPAHLCESSLHAASCNIPFNTYEKLRVLSSENCFPKLDDEKTEAEDKFNQLRWQLTADHNEWPKRYTIIRRFLFELVDMTSLDKNYWEVINLLFALSSLFYLDNNFTYYNVLCYNIYVIT